MKANKWNTYFTSCNNQMHRVRKTKAGWNRRVVRPNGQNLGPVAPLTDLEGEACFATAQNIADYEIMTYEMILDAALPKARGD